MSNFVVYSLSDGGELKVAITQRGNAINERHPEAIIKFDEAMTSIRGLCQQLRKDFETFDEVEVDFGIAVDESAHLVVSAFKSECNFHISLRWKNSSDNASTSSSSRTTPAVIYPAGRPKNSQEQQTSDANMT